MARCRQAALRRADRSSDGFPALVADFGMAERFEGARVLDLGPGHFEFPEAARDGGAREVVTVDNDPAVIELGEYRGFRTIEGDFRNIGADELGGTFDGMFNRLSFNAFWYYRDDAQHEAWVDRIAGLLEDDGWALMIPWNVASGIEIDDERTQEVLGVQARALARHGFDRYALGPEAVARYGVSSTDPFPVAYVRNLPVPESLRDSLVPL